MPVAEDIRKKYVPTIGIETHVQLKTKTKLFSAVSNDARNAAPNTLISHIDTGMPGALPVLNQAAIELCIVAALALNTAPQKFSRFERKHYFYPDLPKGYQITQYEAPIIKDGFVEVPSADGNFKIEIERANLEEDAGKNTHPEGADYSLVDLNRAGTPLLEIVSRPDIHSPAQAKQYAREIWLTMKYAGVTEGDLYLGHVRFDINVSVSKENGKLGTRSEIKNLNSFRSVENAVAYEIDRQIELLEKGQKVVQETRGWDEAKQKSTSQRGKEEARDYRYMPEPDIPPVELDEEFIKKASAEIPKMPSFWRVELKNADINSKEMEILLDAEAEFNNGYLNLVKSFTDKEEGKQVVNLIINVELPQIRETGISYRISENDRKIIYKDAIDFRQNGMMNSNQQTEFIQRILSGGNFPDNRQKFAEQYNLIQLSNEAEIKKIVLEVLAQNQEAARDVKNGEMKAIGFLVGQVMSKSQGKANPQIAQEIIKQQLGL